MRLSKFAFARYWQVHEWAGVSGGLLLYLMCLCGTVSLFRAELLIWEEPLAQAVGNEPLALAARLERGLARAGAVNPEVWLLLPRAGGALQLAYQPRASQRWQHAWIDAQGNFVPEREQLSNFIYHLHFLWHDTTGAALYYFAGVVAVLLLLLLVTGVLIHLKDIARQFHQFRPWRPRRVVWSDLHKVLGVMGLPFQLMYAYTGAWLVLAPLLLRCFIGPVFDGDAARAAALSRGIDEIELAQPGASVPVLGLDQLESRARAEFPELVPEAIELIQHGDAEGRFVLWGELPGTPREQIAVRLREIDGSVEATSHRQGGNAADGLRRWMRGLHFARFGGAITRCAFFVLGLLLCATLLSGLGVWIARRHGRYATAGSRCFTRLTIGVGAGSLVALAALFVLSRALPLTLARRGAYEELGFVVVLLACVLWALFSAAPAWLWRRQLALASLLFAAVPGLAALHSDAGLFGAGHALAPVVAVDCGLLLSAVTLAATAISLPVRRTEAQHV